MTITSIRTDDPDTPFFNELLFELPGGEIVLHGGLKVPTVPMPDFLAEAFEITPGDFDLLNGTHVPTVREIEADIDAGLVPLVGPREKEYEEDDPSESDDVARHRQAGDDDDQDEEQEQPEAAILNQDS